MAGVHGSARTVQESVPTALQCILPSYGMACSSVYVWGAPALLLCLAAGDGLAGISVVSGGACRHPLVPWRGHTATPARQSDRRVILPTADRTSGERTACACVTEAVRQPHPSRGPARALPCLRPFTLRGWVVDHRGTLPDWCGRVWARGPGAHGIVAQGQGRGEARRTLTVTRLTAGDPVIAARCTPCMELVVPAGALGCCASERMDG